MSEPSGQSDKPVGTGAYVLAALAFIPGLGILLGLPSIGWGLLSRSRGGGKVAAIAATGVALNVLVYATIFYRLLRGDGPFPELKARLAHDDLREATLEIEYWRSQHGQYPDSLAQLAAAPKDARRTPFYDHTAPGTSGARYFYYRRAQDGNHYWLRAVGSDDVPFTADDILPEFPDSERARTGLLLMQ